MVNLLQEASERGVDIDIMMPGKHIDKRVAEIAGADSFNALLDAGVTLWYYQKTMLHSKVITIDDTICCVGSANFNHRSMLKDDEVNMVVIDPDLTSKLNDHFKEDLEFCERIKEDQWKKRNVARKFVERLTNLFKQQI